MDPLLGPLAKPGALPPAARPGEGLPSKPGGDFGVDLGSAVGKIEGQHAKADSALELLATGQEVDLHGAMIELEKADIALRTMVSVRNRVIGAYEQIMNMSL